MEDYNAKINRESIESLATSNLLESLREDIESAERDIMNYLKNDDSKEARAYRDGVQAAFNKVYQMLDKV